MVKTTLRLALASFCLMAVSSSIAQLPPVQPAESLNTAELGLLLFRAKDSLLVTSAAENNEARALLLLKVPGVNVNFPDGSGKTALHHAAANGMRDLVEQLLKARANKDATDGEGNTPLELAKLQEHTEIIELLEE